MTPSQINNNPTTTRLISAASSRILPVAIMVCGNIAFPQLFHLIPGGGPHLAPDIFLYACQRMVLRMARRNCHRYSVAGGQQSAVRNACRGSASGHTDEISSAGRGGIVRRVTRSPRLIGDRRRRSTRLPEHRHPWRVGHLRLIYRGHLRFPHRSSGDAASGGRRLAGHPSAEPIAPIGNNLAPPP